MATGNQVFEFLSEKNEPLLRIVAEAGIAAPMRGDGVPINGNHYIVEGRIFHYGARGAAACDLVIRIHVRRE